MFMTQVRMDLNHLAGDCKISGSFSSLSLQQRAGILRSRGREHRKGQVVERAPTYDNLALCVNQRMESRPVLYSSSISCESGSGRIRNF
jgi:hypothetical protein